MISFLMAISASSFKTFSARTPPVGLLGVMRTMAFVRGVTFARISSRSIW